MSERLEAPKRQMKILEGKSAQKFPVGPRAHHLYLCLCICICISVIVYFYLSEGHLGIQQSNRSAQAAIIFASGVCLLPDWTHDYSKAGEEQQIHTFGMNQAASSSVAEKCLSGIFGYKSPICQLVGMEIKRQFFGRRKLVAKRCHSLEGKVQLFIDVTLMNFCVCCDKSELDVSPQRRRREVL